MNLRRAGVMGILATIVSPLALVALLCLSACVASKKAEPPVVQAKVSPTELASTPEPSEDLQPFSQPVPATRYEIEMIPIPAGTLPDSETLIAPFWMSKVEITWDVFDVFVYERDKEGAGEEPEVDAISRPSKPYIPPDLGFGHEGYAAISIRFQSAVNFCKWLSVRTGRTYRLPTTEEWEYACRARHDPPTEAELGEYAWYEANAEWATHPVGEKKANAFGLHDMLGNVAEWCTTGDGTGALAGAHFDSFADEVSPTARMEYEPAWQMLDPQVPKSPWWLSDGPWAGLRVICVPEAD